MSLQLPKGTRDFSPEDKIIVDKIVSTLKKVFELYGYAPMDTPVLERYDVLSSKYAGGSEILKETFRLKDQGNRELGLRYDLTVPLARYVGMNPNIKTPFKRYQIGEVFRDGPVASSRYRQFLQCDVDVVGSASIAADAEMIAVAYAAFNNLDLEVVVKFSNRKLLNDMLDYCGIEKDKQEGAILSIDKLEKFGASIVKNELRQQKISDDKINKVIGIVNIKGSGQQKIAQLKNLLKDSKGLAEIEQLSICLKDLNFEAEFDVSLARGLAYYTGTVIEAFLKNSSVKSSVCAGGRYDAMIGSFLGKGSYPSVGISFGIDRIYDAVAERQKYGKKTSTQAYIIPIRAFGESMKIARQLREAGINTDIDLMDKSPSKNLEYANSLGIPYAVFVGKRELEQNKVKLRDMKTGGEELLEIKAVIAKLKI